MRISTKYYFLIILTFITSTLYAVTADFRADYISGCSPLVVHFTNTSTGATSYYWDLGNGTTSTLTDPSGSYISAGTYTCTLTAYSGGSSSTRTMVITVYPSPTVSFFCTDTAVCPGEPTSFVSTSILGTSGAGTYFWSFGDGATSTLASPSHTYATSGSYNVTLIVTNSSGCSSTLTLPAYVRVYTPPSASFSVSGAYAFCRVPARADFVNFSSGSGTLTYAWDFGDGSTSTATNPTHDYTATGTYTVKLIVTDANGCVDSIIRTSYISVSTFNASFSIATTICQNMEVRFLNTSDLHYASDWDFGDGGRSTADSPYHTYRAPGTYTVRLIVFNGACYDTAYNSVTVRPRPTGSFTFSPTIACPAPTTQVFTASVASGTSVIWLFGDGSTASGTTTAHTYAFCQVDTIRMVMSDTYGCVDTISRLDTIRSLEFNIYAVPAGGCAPVTVSFTSRVATGCPVSGAYPSSIVAYDWDFGDGSTHGTASTASHTYSSTGDYRVTCNILTANGCTTGDTMNIHVGRPPRISARAVPSHVCYGIPINFIAYDSTGGTVDYYDWNFGDGVYRYHDSTNVVTHDYVRPGRFVVTVRGVDNDCPGSWYTITDTIIVDSPMAIINLNMSCDPRTRVTFFNNSLGATSFTWLFSDGTSYTSGDTLVHNFPSLGTYTATLCTYNSRSGCRDTVPAVFTLGSPVIRLTVRDSTLCSSDSVYVTARMIGASAINTHYYLDSILRSMDTFMHVPVFGRGRHDIMVIMQDNQGCWDTGIFNDWILVGGPLDSFSAAPMSGCVPLPVTFTDRSTYVTGTSPVRFTWIYGDGRTDSTTATTTTHTYTFSGSYAVTCIVRDNIGCSDTVTRPAMIDAWQPVANFFASNLYPCLGVPTTFSNTTTGGVSYYWTFGDGDTSTAYNPTHTYTALGTYTVTLIATDAHGCTDTISFPNYITVTKPNASFLMSDSFSICAPLTVRFTNTSTGASSYNWSLGGGVTSSIGSPSNLYLTPGFNVIRLIATNTHGCTDTAYDAVSVYGYAGAFTYTPLTGCSPLSVFFHAGIANVPTIIWDFADGNTTRASRDTSTTHIYTRPGAYVPKLILSDGTGCQNSSLGLDTIKVNMITAGFKTIPDPVCINAPTSFVDTSYDMFSRVASWHWEFQGGDTSNVSNPSHTFTATGVYTVSLNVVDSWGCSAVVTKTITVYPLPTITASPDTVICISDTANLRGYGGVSYVWTPAATVLCPTCQSTGANPVVATTYTVVGSDEHGCKNSDSVTINMRIYTVARAWGDTEVCRNVPVKLFDTGGTKYTWIPSAGLDFSNVWNPIAKPESTTVYTVIARYGSCIPDTDYVTVKIQQLPVINAGPDQRLLAGSLAYINATGSNIQSLLWTNSATLDCDTCYRVIGNMLSTTTYVVTATSDFGCKAFDDITIYMYCDNKQIFIPTAFTPNGDGENDLFYPRGKGVEEVKAFRIYNRWGQLLFERTGIKLNDEGNAWDGTLNGAPARPDVYVYLLEATCDTGEPLFLKGDVTIIK